VYTESTTTTPTKNINACWLTTNAAASVIIAIVFTINAYGFIPSPHNKKMSSPAFTTKAYEIKVLSMIFITNTCGLVVNAYDTMINACPSAANAMLIEEMTDSPGES
jgi:hypothetical protein